MYILNHCLAIKIVNKHSACVILKHTPPIFLFYLVLEEICGNSSEVEQYWLQVTEINTVVQGLCGKAPHPAWVQEYRTTLLATLTFATLVATNSCYIYIPNKYILKVHISCSLRTIGLGFKIHMLQSYNVVSFLLGDPPYLSYLL